ncbi:hypothetical protein Ahy_A10g050734 [Arachis hypogaea]|uniref:Protein FAR1-RELATED SEQUENCE n=1 Tax=Arachis hypogaea TaxID=3818 RepID=A0A445BA81_ARAHY|nr:hypothetical protein Ahy_A10g050734 [Arachis hypogaea]
MDVNSEPLNSQDNVEDCLMTGVEENVNCTCDCGGSSSKCVGFEVRKGDTARGKDGTQRRRQFFCNKEGKIADKYISNSNRKKEHKVLTRMGCEAMLAVILGEYDKKYGFEENEWVLNEYQKRKTWASAYLQDKFCAGFRTTSRCEGINNFIKRFIGIRQSLLELVQNLEHALRDYKHNGLGSQFKMVYGEPVLTTHLAALELCATNFYTREMFGKVKTEIEEVVALDVINEENISTTIVLKVKECDRGQHIYTVLYERNTKIWSVNVLGGVVKAFPVATCFVP